LPDLPLVELIGRLRLPNPTVPVLLVVAQERLPAAVEALTRGACDCLIKPIEEIEIRELVGKMVRIAECGGAAAAGAVSEPIPGLPALGLVGRCPAMLDVYQQIGRLAGHDISVVVLGETGSGKELVARAIHRYSRRAAFPFLAFNCGAIPEPLLESELFGHEQGAFTGAFRQRVGVFERCAGGTLFLDEIGDLAPAGQVKLLRVLQERSFERVGGSDTIPVDVRVVAATNKDLKALVAEGRFRRDFFYRLCEAVIELPPLRQRPGDMRHLVRHLMNELRGVLRSAISGVHEETLRLLESQSWGGQRPRAARRARKRHVAPGRRPGPSAGVPARPFARAAGCFRRGSLARSHRRLPPGALAGRLSIRLCRPGRVGRNPRRVVCHAADGRKSAPRREFPGHQPQSAAKQAKAA
jgi:two-component system, NtrC family, response regulator AtoC